MPAEARHKREIMRGRIYQDVYHKREGDHRPARASTDQADLEVAYIDGGELAFESTGARDRALGDGVFLLRIPDGLDVDAGDEFARQFYQGPDVVPYGRFHDLRHGDLGDPLLGFHQRVNQIEQFLLERRFWARHFPPEIAALGEAFTELSQHIVRSVLEHVALPEAHWRRATGGCSDRTGSYHLTFNHYRPTLAQIGLNSHKDDGFVTILRTVSPGLEANRRSRWEAIPTDPSYFVVNFGLSMEILTAQCDRPVAAIMHRVTHQRADRFSFGHFSSSNCVPGVDDGIYRYTSSTGQLDRVCGSRELIEENDYEIYEGTDAPEGAAL